MLRFTFILTLLFFCNFSNAQRKVIKYDSTAIVTRNFNASAIDRYKADPAFQYDRSHEAPQNWWTRFWRWFWDQFDDIFESPNGIRTTRYFFIAISVVILALAVYIFSGMRKGGLFGKKNKEDPLAYSVMEDDIHAINFDAAIESAINERNYRFAVRLLYLQTLKNLTDGGYIDWQLNKTNVVYVHELDGNAYQQGFYNLTRQFENNWYGDLPIEVSEFNAVKNQFNQFNKNLS